MTPNDCNTLVRSFGIVRLYAGSDCAGPYVIRVGSVIVGAFGFTRDGEASDFVDVWRTEPPEDPELPPSLPRVVATARGIRAFNKRRGRE